MAYTIRLLEQPTGRWAVELWNRKNRIYFGGGENRTKESARAEGRMALQHRDKDAEYVIVERSRTGRTLVTFSSIESLPLVPKASSKRKKPMKHTRTSGDR